VDDRRLRGVDLDGPDHVDPRDVLARCTRAIEAIRDGETTFGERIIEDLAQDMWSLVERSERAR
jgi:hypothetical protein